MLHRGGPQLVDRVYSRGSGAGNKNLKRDLWISALSATPVLDLSSSILYFAGSLSIFMSLPFESTGNYRLSIIDTSKYLYFFPRYLAFCVSNGFYFTQNQPACVQSVDMNAGFG